MTPELFFLISKIFYAAIHLYIFIRLWRIVPKKTGTRLAVFLPLILFACCYFAGMRAESALPFGWVRTIQIIGSFWIFIALYTLMILLLIDLTRLLNRLFHFLPPHLAHPGLRTQRRIAGGIATGLLLICGMGYLHFSRPAVVHLTLKTDRGAGVRDSVRIVMASDLHLGYILNKREAKRFVREINAQQGDIILLAGDVIDRSPGPVIERNLREELSELNAPLGVYAVPGNHEYYGDPETSIAYIESAGITLLRDRAVPVDSSFYLIGRDDYYVRNRASLKRLTDFLPDDMPRILLDHQPRSLGEAAENGIALQLSGHTHDGQFFPVNLIVKGMYEVSHGYKQKGETHFYVSSGLGLWNSMVRVGTRSEIVAITLLFE